MDRPVRVNHRLRVQEYMGASFELTTCKQKKPRISSLGHMAMYWLICCRGWLHEHLYPHSLIYGHQFSYLLSSPLPSLFPSFLLSSFFFFNFSPYTSELPLFSTHTGVFVAHTSQFTTGAFVQTSSRRPFLQLFVSVLGLTVPHE